MITKSKFIKGLWFVKVPKDTNEFNLLKCSYSNSYSLCCNKMTNLNYALTLKVIHLDQYKLKNPKDLFLTKLATEEDWKELLYWRAGDNKLTDGLSLLKAEGLDNEKNYLIIKEDE